MEYLLHVMQSSVLLKVARLFNGISHFLSYFVPLFSLSSSSLLADIFQLFILPAAPRWLCQGCSPSEFLSASSLPPSVSVSVSMPLYSLFLPLCLRYFCPPFSFHLYNFFRHLNCLNSTFSFHFSKILSAVSYFAAVSSFTISISCPVIVNPQSLGFSNTI